MSKAYTYGHCSEKKKPEGCQLHNLHCGYPDCDRREPAQPKPEPSECPYDMGYDMEHGPLGCLLTLKNDGVCICAGLHPEIQRLSEENATLRKALTPSAETKAALMGEFAFNISDCDADGNESRREVIVPWVTIKEIMKAIAALAQGGET